MGLLTQNVRNIGSTWYGPRDLLMSCANLTMHTMTYINQWEFTPLEKDGNFMGVRNWPNWHYGVLSMYGADIAINHCTYDTGFRKRPDLLDFYSTSDASPGLHPHVHVWQVNTVFSKFAFKMHKYKNIDLNLLNPEKNISAYCLYHALKANPDYAW
jgi:hypothetical protein